MHIKVSRYDLYIALNEYAMLWLQYCCCLLLLQFFPVLFVCCSFFACFVVCCCSLLFVVAVYLGVYNATNNLHITKWSMTHCSYWWTSILIVLDPPIYKNLMDILCIHRSFSLFAYVLPWTVYWLKGLLSVWERVNYNCCLTPKGWQS